MIENLPTWIEIGFIATCILTIGLFHYSNGKPNGMTFLIVVWSIMHSVLAYTGFYQITDTSPPRFALVLLPVTALVIYGLLTKQKRYFQKKKMRLSTFLHSVRLPVEIILFGLFTHEMIPELMTFEGRNYDIIVGITAPIIGLLYLKSKVSRQLLLLWNIIGLGFIFFILINGILSAELPFQQFGFEQPNRAINYFPFILLPATIVPLVIWTHLSDIINLRQEIKMTTKK